MKMTNYHTYIWKFSLSTLNSKCTSYSNNYIWITIIYLIYICHAFFSLHLTSWTMSLTCQGYPRSGGGGGYRRPRGTRGGGGHGCRGDRWGLLGRGGGPADWCRTWITALVFEKKKSHATFNDFSSNCISKFGHSLLKNNFCS